MTPDFRSEKPARRLTPSSKSSNYHTHREDLRVDFNFRCGYCGTHEDVIRDHMQIDHFIPKKPKCFTPSGDLNAYHNLVFACRSCNMGKRNKWPTCDQAIPNNGQIGWEDPAGDNYAGHFERQHDGSIKSITDLGKHMHFHLRLGHSRHSLLWKKKILLDKYKTILSNSGTTEPITIPIEELKLLIERL